MTKIILEIPCEKCGRPGSFARTRTKFHYWGGAKCDGSGGLRQAISPERLVADIKHELKIAPNSANYTADFSVSDHAQRIYSAILRP